MELRYGLPKNNAVFSIGQFVAYCNTLDSSDYYANRPITVFTAAGIISGNLIPEHHAYLIEHENALQLHLGRKAMNPDDVEDEKREYKAEAQEIHLKAKTDFNSGLEPEYLHLIDPQLPVGLSLMPFEGMTMVLKVSAVFGYTLNGIKTEATLKVG